MSLFHLQSLSLSLHLFFPLAFPLSAAARGDVIVLVVVNMQQKREGKETVSSAVLCLFFILPQYSSHAKRIILFWCDILSSFFPFFSCERLSGGGGAVNLCFIFQPSLALLSSQTLVGKMYDNIDSDRGNMNSVSATRRWHELADEITTYLTHRKRLRAAKSNRQFSQIDFQSRRRHWLQLVFP